jgi:hypothetical protein
MDNRAIIDNINSQITIISKPTPLIFILRLSLDLIYNMNFLFSYRLLFEQPNHKLSNHK